MFLLLTLFVFTASAGPATETYQNQYCTDPRTMTKHPAYTEWADAYSCARHRCQPGGRNLAIYTVGCKRVEAPESAIECEEVVEDTNMQFPYCCTRLRCLVVVRGEVWTRVLGQPWETLPAAPWSHMYKMKKPPPSDTNFLPKTGAASGPVYELAEPSKKKMMRSNKRDDAADCQKPRASESAVPDIIIALETEKKKNKDEHEEIETKHKKEKPAVSGSMFEAETYEPQQDTDLEETTEKMQGQEIPSNQWNENEPSIDDASNKETRFQSDLESDKAVSDEDEKKPASLQTLVDAIGTRMKDIEDVVQKMTDKVQGSDSEEKKLERDADIHENRKDKRPSSDDEHYKRQSDTEVMESRKEKRPNSYDEHYKRFTIKNRSKYAHSLDRTTEPPSFIEDTNMNGHFSDGDNLIRRSKPREPSLTYMAPVETRRKSSAPVSEANEEENGKHKKHAHKKGKKKGRSHKKHHGREKDGRRFNKVDSGVERNVVSLEDSGAPVGN